MFGRRIIYKAILSKAIALCVGFYLVCGSLYAGAQSIVSVQVGDHPEFVRLSLSWSQPVSFDYVRTATGFEIRFFKKSELLFDRLISIFPGSSYRHEGNQTVLNIQVPPTRKLMAKSYGNITYLDIYKDGVQDLKLVPHPGIKASHTAANLQKEEVKPPEVDLQNLFRKVADYLGELKPDIESTILSQENGLLLKYPDAPIAVYENDKKVFIVILKDEYPVLEKQLEEKYSIQVTRSNGAFVLQVSPKNFTNPVVSKTSEGWHIKFISGVVQGKTPQFFIKEDEAQIKINRAGVFDAVEVGDVNVFCTLSPDVFVPLQFEQQNIIAFATSAGVAFKVDAPEKIVVDRDFITLSVSGGVLPQEKPEKLDFSRLNPSENFMLKKQALFEEIAASEDSDTQSRIDLIQLYLANVFSSEATCEIKALEQESANLDPEFIGLLSAIAEIAEKSIDEKSIEKLFPFHKNNLEAAAWYAFRLARLEDRSIPRYLGEHLVTLIDAYPEPLKSTLLISLADNLMSGGEVDLTEAIIKKINEVRLSLELVSLKQFLQMKINRTKNSKVDSLDVKRLMAQAQNPLLEIRLIIESGLVDLTHKDHYQYIESLEQLTPLIEGDPYHATALLFLIDYHFATKNYLKALEFVTAFKKSYKHIYPRMRPRIQSIMSDLIREKVLEVNGLIYTLHVLTEFVEELPSGAQMANFILDLTQKLHRIGLLEESIQLIERYTKREDVRLDSKKQREMFFQLVDFYIQNEKESKAKSLMDIVEKSTELSKEDLEKMRVLKAKCALLNNQTEEALTILQSSHSLEGLKLKSSLLWAQENWSGASDAMEELIDIYGAQLDVERKERYIVHLAAALVLNEEKYRSKNMGRQKTRVTLQGIVQKYEDVLSKYKELFQELTTEPHNSMTDTLNRGIIMNEINETTKLENLFNQLKAVPTN